MNVGRLEPEFITELELINVTYIIEFWRLESNQILNHRDILK